METDVILVLLGMLLLFIAIGMMIIFIGVSLNCECVTWVDGMCVMKKVIYPSLNLSGMP